MKVPKSVLIKKSVVIEALMTEPLRAKEFFHTGRQCEIDINTCSVCAVGAVLRKSLGAKKLEAFDKQFNYGDHIPYAGFLGGYIGQTILKGSFTSDEYGYLDDIVAEKNYLGALSIYFEALIDKYEYAELEGESSLPFVRNLLVAFVKKHFPTQFRLNLT